MNLTSIKIKINEQDHPVIHKRSATELGVTVGSSKDLAAMFVNPEQFFSKIDPSIPMPINFRVQKIKFTGTYSDLGSRMMIPIHIQEHILDRGMKPDIFISNCKVGEAEMAGLRKLATENDLRLREVRKTEINLLEN